MLGPVCVGELHGFRQNVHVSGRVVPVVRKGMALENVQHLHQVHSARARRRHGVYPVAPVVSDGRPSFGRGVRREVPAGHEASFLFHVRRYFLRHRSPVEGGGSVFPYFSQGPGEVFLHENLSHPRRLPVFREKDLHAFPGSFHPFSRFQKGLSEFPVHGESLFRKLYRGPQSLFERDGSVFLERRREPRDRSRNPRRVDAVSGLLVVYLPVFVEKHVPRRFFGRLLPVVHGHGLAPVGKVDHHEPAAPQVSGSRESDRQGESHGDRGVHGVSSVSEHFESGEGRQPVGRHRHAVFERAGLPPALAAGGKPGAGRRRREQNEAQAERDGPSSRSSRLFAVPAEDVQKERAWA